MSQVEIVAKDGAKLGMIDEGEGTVTLTQIGEARMTPKGAKKGGRKGTGTGGGTGGGSYPPKGAPRPK